MTPEQEKLLKQLEAVFHAHYEAADTVKAFTEDAKASLAGHAEYVTKAKEALDAKGRPERVSVKLSELLNPEYIQEQFVAHRATIVPLYPNLLTEMAFIYRVALFDAFVPDMMKAVLLHHPGILTYRDKNSERNEQKKLTWGDVLNLHAKGILVQSLVDREVGQISRQSVKEQIKWVASRLQVSLVSDAGREAVLIEIAARRNILVHNNGIVNQQYLTDVPSSPLKDGERVVVDNDYWTSSNNFLKTTALDFMFALTRRYCPGSYLDEVDEIVR